MSGSHPGERHTCTDDQASGFPWQLELDVRHPSVPFDVDAA